MQNMKLIEQIEQYRKIKGMNKQTLCAFAKINPSNYSQYMSGKREMSGKTIDALLNALDCKIIIIDKRV